MVKDAWSRNAFAFVGWLSILGLYSWLVFYVLQFRIPISDLSSLSSERFIGIATFLVAAIALVAAAATALITKTETEDSHDYRLRSIVFGIVGVVLAFATLPELMRAEVKKRVDIKLRPIVWTQFLSHDGEDLRLLGRAIVGPGEPCPPATVDDKPRAMQVRTTGTDPEFSITMCELVYAAQEQAKIDQNELPAFGKELSRIVVIGDTGCRIVHYEAPQNCNDAKQWPFRAIAATIADREKPQLIIHVGDYHYREKPCADRAGCAGSTFGDNWPTWKLDFFDPARTLLLTAPWLMMRGNHEECERAGAGWRLLLSPEAGYSASDRCPNDTKPYVLRLPGLTLAVFDTASSDLAFDREDRVTRYETDIGSVACSLFSGDSSGDSWLLLHQPLWVSFGKRKDKPFPFPEQDLLSTVESVLGRVEVILKPTEISPPDEQAGSVLGKELAVAKKKLRAKLIDPLQSFRWWFSEEAVERLVLPPCATDKAPSATPPGPPKFSLVLSGDTHIFQMFAPADTAKPLQLVAGMSGDNLEKADKFPDAGKQLLGPLQADLFGVKGTLWARNTFGYVLLERAKDGPWTATLHSVQGRPIVGCDLAKRTCIALPAE